MKNLSLANPIFITATASAYLCLAFAMVALSVIGCDDGKKKTSSSGAFPSMPSASSKQGSSSALVSDGDVVLDDPASFRTTDNLSRADPLARGKTPSAPKSGSKTTTTNPESDLRWAILLLSFTGESHAEMARSAIAGITAQLPDLQDVRVERVGKGSAIVTGRYPSPSDPAAKEAFKKVKTIHSNGRRAFQSAMLVRISSGDVGPPAPYDLRTLRARFPNTKPLYTLQLAAWSTFGDASIKYEQCKASAEQFAARLRAQREEAWFHHDEDSETSVVTIGHFDSSAYDSRSTLFAPEVEVLFDKYPAHLVNGEPVEIQFKAGDAPNSRRPQAPRLVEVP
ncbi:MAG: hypothetical protein EXS10_03150 [Phycisphaerales bacterium]|nr:hypothetical protein [Phycisphaerales bacterium]